MNQEIEKKIRNFSGEKILKLAQNVGIRPNIIKTIPLEELYNIVIKKLRKYDKEEIDEVLTPFMDLEILNKIKNADLKSLLKKNVDKKKYNEIKNEINKTSDLKKIHEIYTKAFQELPNTSKILKDYTQENIKNLEEANNLLHYALRFSKDYNKFTNGLIYNLINEKLNRNYYTIRIQFIDGSEEFRDFSSEKNQKKFYKKVIGNNFIYDVTEEDLAGSDKGLLNIQVRKIEEVEIMYTDLVFNKQNKNKKESSGGFFNFANYSDLDLSRYQIFNIQQLEELTKTFTLTNEQRKNWTKEQIKQAKKDFNLSKPEPPENCLYHTIKLAVEESVLEIEKKNEIINTLRSYKLDGNSDDIVLKHIANKFKIKINKQSYCNNAKKYNYYYKKSDNILTIDIALFHNHYFINSDVKLSDTDTNFSESGKLNFNLDKAIKLFNEGYFRYSNLLNYFVDAEPAADKFDFSGKCIAKKIELKKFNLEKEKVIIYADFETYITKNNMNKEFMISYAFDKLPEIYNLKTIYHKDGTIKKSCAERFIEEMLELSRTGPNVLFIIYFHNLKFDMSFFLRFVCINRYIRKQNTTYGFYVGKNLRFLDSFKIVNYALKNFQFNLKLTGDYKKETMFYDLYNQENINKKFVTLEELNKYYPEITEKDIIDLNDNAFSICKNKNKKYIEDPDFSKKFYHIKHAAFYCNQDVRILKEGMQKMNIYYKQFIDQLVESKFSDIENFDMEKFMVLKNTTIYDHLTISSLADTILKYTGCYDGVFQLSGDYQAFIQKCISGGTCASEYNKKIDTNFYNLEKLKIQDFDAVSLYPSAMAIMPGILKGTPKRFEDPQNFFESDNFSNLEKLVSYYFCKIAIKKVNKPWGISNIYSTNKNGIKEFHNMEKSEKFVIMYVGKQQLEDMIKYQEIEFEFLEVIYFDKGYNTNINHLMKLLFNTRVTHKKAGNPVQEIFKLIMNSAYGKSILKPVNSMIQCVSKDKVENFKTNNHNKIIKYITYRNFTMFKLRKSIRTHFNIPQFGCMVLDYSKKIMNEVQNIAYNNDIRILYRDTDSMHMFDKDIPLLQQKFKEEYNRELIGSNMGQFHSDFNSSILKGDIYSIRSIILGKKCYLDVLEGKDKNGNIAHDLHIRMKGIPLDVIKITADTKLSGTDNFNSVINLYELLYKGESIDFDLHNGKAPLFKHIERDARSIIVEKEKINKLKISEEEKINKLKNRSKSGKIEKLTKLTRTLKF